MPRQPLGERTMTAAERQARYRIARGRRHASGPHPPAGRSSQPRSALARCGCYPHRLASRVRHSAGELATHLQEGATVQALQAICDLDLGALQALEPPRGFGRD
jgi:hypothetical protein